jgi:arylsulfatase A-like enzyme
VPASFSLRYDRSRNTSRRRPLPSSLRRWAPVVLIGLAVILPFQPSHPSLAAPPAKGVTSLTPSPSDTPDVTDTVVPTDTPVPTATFSPTAAPSASPTVTFSATAPPSPTSTGFTTPVPEPTFPKHHVVLIVIDAGRLSDLYAFHLPHLQALMKHGIVYDQAYTGELSSSTPNVHVTIGTGTLPRENGFDGFGWAAPGTRKQVDFRNVLADGQIEPVLKSLPEPSVAARLHQFMPGAKIIAGSGHKDYAVVGLGGAAADYELYGKWAGKAANYFVPTSLPGHLPPRLTKSQQKQLTLKKPLPIGAEDRWAFTYASIVAQRVRPQLLMLNIPEIDTLGHWRGPEATATVRTLMTNIDAGVGRIEALYQRLGILKNTDFIITADHSMMESRAAHNWGMVRAAALQVKTQVVRGDTEGGSIWLQDPTKAKAMAEQVVKLRPSHVMAVFYRSAPGNDYQFIQASPMSWLVNKKVATALKDLVDTTAGQNGPDDWVLYRENYTVVPRNVNGIWKGTHGGATWKVQHIPLIISGAGVRSGVHSKFPARSIDMAPTMERLLGLPGIKRDGVVLADALRTYTSDERKAQQAVEPARLADVQALQAQSVADDRTLRWPRLPGRPSRCTKKGAVTAYCGTTAQTATNS